MSLWPSVQVLAQAEGRRKHKGQLASPPSSLMESHGQPHPPLGLMDKFSGFRKQHCPTPHLMVIYWAEWEVGHTGRGRQLGPPTLRKFPGWDLGCTERGTDCPRGQKAAARAGLCCCGWAEEPTLMRAGGEGESEAGVPERPRGTPLGKESSHRLHKRLFPSGAP